MVLDMVALDEILAILLSRTVLGKWSNVCRCGGKLAVIMPTATLSYNRLVRSTDEYKYSLSPAMSWR
jgi:hypothetical protein